MTSWLVTGSRGQLGKSVVERLRSDNHQVAYLDRIDFDISNRKLVIRKILELKPQIIINCAAYTNVDQAEIEPFEAFKVNATGVANLAEAAKTTGSIFITVSTDYVFSGFSRKPLDVSDICNPINEYGKTKLRGEQLAIEIYPEGTYIFRTAWLYSKYGNNFAKKICREGLLSNKPLKIVNDQVGQPTSSNNLAFQIIDSALKAIPFGIYHATNQGKATWFNFAYEIFDLLELDTSRLTPITSDEFDSIAKRPKYSVLSQDCWNSTIVKPMPDWKNALSQEIFEISENVEREAI